MSPKRDRASGRFIGSMEYTDPRPTVKIRAPLGGVVNYTTEPNGAYIVWVETADRGTLRLADGLRPERVEVRAGIGERVERGDILVEVRL